MPSGRARQYTAHLPILDPRFRDQGRTRGWVVAPRGAGLPVVSGVQEGNRDGLLPGFESPVLAHAEGSAARLMRWPAAPTMAELVINNQMCSRCRRDLPAVLPMGKWLRVFWRHDDGRITFEGDFLGTGHALV